jgi:ferritin-like metal-binding protein YciE
LAQNLFTTGLLRNLKFNIMQKSKTDPSSKNGRSTTGKAKPDSDASASLRELFEEQLKDIYWAEKALTKALPRMAKNATAEKLVRVLNQHLDVTQKQVSRLEKVFVALGKKAQAKKCDAMEGLIKEGEGLIEETEPGAVRDAGIIAACQKVEHYEIASYGTLASFANLLKESEAAKLLMETLAEEKEADETLTEVAQSSINLQADQEGEANNSKDGATESRTNKSGSARRKVMA